MKKFTFFVVFICLSSFVHAQSSHSLGLNTSYLSQKSLGLRINNIPKVGINYNYFINKKHGVSVDLSLSRLIIESNNLQFFDPNFPLDDIVLENYSLEYALHYIFKHNQWFVKGGLNLEAFNIHSSTYTNGQLDEQTFFDIDRIIPIPEIHFALGRDFDLGKVNIRVNGFLERGFLASSYSQYGGTVGLFYEISK